MGRGSEAAAGLEAMVHFPLPSLHAQSGWLHAQGAGAGVTPGLWALSPSPSGWAAFGGAPAAQRGLGWHFANLQPDSVAAAQQLLGDKGDALRGRTWQLPCAAHPSPVWDPGDRVTRQRGMRWGQDVLAQPPLPT